MALGQKGYVLIPGAPDFPAIVIGESTVTMTQGRTRSFRNERANVLSLRTPHPDAEDQTPYLAVSNENIDPRFFPARSNMVPGIDVDADTGEIFTVEKLQEIAVAAARALVEKAAATRTAAQATAEVELG